MDAQSLPELPVRHGAHGPRRPGHLRLSLVAVAVALYVLRPSARPETEREARQAGRPPPIYGET